MAMTLGKKAKHSLSAVSILVLLTAGILLSTSGVKAESLSDQTAIPATLSGSEHGVLAKHFEDSAREMQAKADEQKKLLEQYEQIKLYGWQSHNLKSRTAALIRKYEQDARSNMKEAAVHRQIAQSKHHFAAPDGKMIETGSN
jgi:hypothetical protein